MIRWRGSHMHILCAAAVLRLLSQRTQQQMQNTHEMMMSNRSHCVQFRILSIEWNSSLCVCVLWANSKNNFHTMAACTKYTTTANKKTNKKKSLSTPDSTTMSPGRCAVHLANSKNILQPISPLYLARIRRAFVVLSHIMAGILFSLQCA